MLSIFRPHLPPKIDQVEDMGENNNKENILYDIPEDDEVKFTQPIMKKPSNLGLFFLQVLSIMQIEYLPKIEFGIKAVLNVILAKGSWILGLLVMDQMVKSIVPVRKNFGETKIIIIFDTIRHIFVLFK